MNAKDIRWDHVTKNNKINDQLKDTKTSTIIELKQQVDDLTTDNVDLKYKIDQCQKEIVRLTLKHES